MPLILGANSVSGGYEVDNSLRFNSGSSDHLSRTPASAGNRKTWTWSCWIKRSAVGSNNCILNGGGNGFLLVLQSSNVLEIYNFSGSYQLQLITNQLFRDTSAWYHIVFVLDTTQATDTNRAKVYLNGSQITSFSTATYPSQNADLLLNNNNANYIGTYDASGQYFGGYMSEINFIDGQALTPSSFGEFDSDTNIWKPIPYTGTFGTNGFYLEFKDSSALGDDTSGNGNDWTVNNLTSIDQTTDTPTNNFATLNPLYNYLGGYPPLTEGNTFLTDARSGGNDCTALANIAIPNTGKWFCEVLNVSSSNGFHGVGTPDNTALNCTYYGGNGFKYLNPGGNTAYGATYTTNDIIGIAVDIPNNSVTFYKNGVSQGAISYTFDSALTYFIRVGNGSGDADSFKANFGNPSFTISSGNADANGYGNFEYAVPSGYYALCTKNLAEFG